MIIDVLSLTIKNFSVFHCDNLYFLPKHEFVPPESLNVLSCMTWGPSPSNNGNLFP